MQRDSNIELLRLVAMFLIVLHHISTWGVFPEVYQSNSPINLNASISQILNGFLFVGVNVFILISGYYGIKLRRRSFFNLYFTCAFYGLCGYLLEVVYIGREPGIDIIYSTIFIFSHCPWWFIGAYVGLMFLSPILNVAIENMNKQQHLISLGLLTVMNVWFGYFYHYDMFSTHGFSVAQLVYLYWIGSYIRHYLTIESILKYRWISFVAYFVCALLWGLISLFSHSHHISHWDSFSYNNPLVIVGAISLFCFAISFQFHSAIINWIAKSTIGIYLIHSLNIVQTNLIYMPARKIVQLYQTFLTDNTMIATFSIWMSLLLFTIVVMFACVFIDKIRYFLFNCTKIL